MFISPWNLAQAFLLAVGIVWCKEMFQKAPEHAREFRTGSWVDRITLLLLWALTLVILYLCVHFIYGLGVKIWHGLQQMR